MYNDDNALYEAQQNERIVIGLMLSHQSYYYDLRKQIELDMFTDKQAQDVFKAIMQAENENVTIDIVSVSSRGRDIDPGMLLEWTTSIVGAAINPESLVEAMRRSMKRRRLVTLMQSIGNIMSDGTLPSLVVDSHVSNAFEKYITDAGSKSDVEHISVSVDQIYEEYSDNSDLGQDSIPGLPTGFSAVDACIGGMQEGNLIVIGGATSVGKTAFALNIAQRVAEQGRKVLIVSLEMNAKENTKRFLSAYANIPANKVSLPSVWDMNNKSDRVGQVFESVGKLPINYLCSGDGMPITISRIRTTAMAMKARGGLDLVVVDYLQLLDSNEERNSSDAERLSKISRGLKMLAMSLNVPVIALAQLNREATKGQRPRMSHFKGSSSIEQDANVGILLHRNKGTTAEECFGDFFDPSLHEGHTRIYIDKNRNGMVSDDITLKFNKATTTFFE